MTNVDFLRVPEFYHKYILLVPKIELNKAFIQHQHDLIDVLDAIPDEKWSYRYDEGKWSVKELIQHIIDAERIFCYRALSFARKDSKPLPGFDENTYAQYSRADKRSNKDLMEELSLVQKSSAALFSSFDEEQLNETGIANGNSVYVGAIGYIIIGHTLHHKKLLLERYLD